MYLRQDIRVRGHGASMHRVLERTVRTEDIVLGTLGRERRGFGARDRDKPLYLFALLGH